MHVGAVLIFEGPPPDYEDFCNQIRSRLHLVPRYRQKLAFPPLETGRPLWVDDPNFNLQYHVRHTALPSPGSEEQLRALAARMHSQRLDRSKPLWETWLGRRAWRTNRFALISKTHHALVDGVAGVDLATVLFDLQPVPPSRRTRASRGCPQPEPSAAQLAARAITGSCARRSSSAAGDRRGRAPAAQPRGRARGDRGRRRGRVGGLNPAPRTPLNVPIGPHRRFAFVRNELSDFKLVKDALGGTVNDVVLTVVAGALRQWLRTRGVRTEGIELRALVPVSIRTKDQHHQLGNRIAAMRGPLPVYVEDPVARLAVVREAMDGLKESKQALGAEVLAGAAGLRAADDPRAGLADQLLHAAVQPDRHQRAGPAVPALRARARAAGPVPGRLPAARPRAGDRDHVLQRRDRLRAARRLRRDARPRRARRRTCRSRSRSSWWPRRSRRRPGRGKAPRKTGSSKPAPA